MFAKAMGRLSCLFGKHQRSQRKTHTLADGRQESRCRYCGVRLERHGKGAWTVRK